MPTNILNSMAITAAALPVVEGGTGAIAITVPSGIPEGRVRIRVHANITGNASASTVTMRIRQGATTAGNQIYTTGAVNIGAGAIAQVFAEVEDGSNWTNTGNGFYVITLTGSLAGNINGGYVTAEAY